MRRVGREPAELIERRFEPCERVVDDAGEAADFIVLVGNRQALVEAFSGDAPRVGRQMIDRRERSAGEDIPANARQSDHERQTKDEDGQHFGQLLSEPLF